MLWKIIDQLKSHDIETCQEATKEITDLVSLALDLESGKSNICFGSNVGAQCAICMETFYSQEQFTTIACGHSYHKSCLRDLMEQSRRCCSICNTDICYETLDL